MYLYYHLFYGKKVQKLFILEILTNYKGDHHKKNLPFPDLYFSELLIA